MKTIAKKLTPFFLVILVSTPLLFYPKIDFIVLINQQRTVLFDLIFSKASSLGNALIVVFVFIFLLRFKFKWIAVFLCAFAIQVIIVLLLKKGFFAGELRPYLYLKHNGLLDLVQLIDGVKIRHINTFPSGHTATIFFLVSFFSLMTKNKSLRWLLLGLGLTVGFSRIYLVQHWFTDVYFGMIIGTFSSVLGYLAIMSSPKKWHSNKIQVNLGILEKYRQNVLR